MLNKFPKTVKYFPLRETHTDKNVCATVFWSTSDAPGEPFSRSAPFRAADARVHRGHLRRQRRPHQAQAAARALPADVRAAPLARIRRGGRLTHSHVRRPVSRQDARVGSEVPGRFPIRQRRLGGLLAGTLLYGGRAQMKPCPYASW